MFMTNSRTMYTVPLTVVCTVWRRLVWVYKFDVDRNERRQRREGMIFHCVCVLRLQYVTCAVSAFICRRIAFFPSSTIWYVTQCIMSSHVFVHTFHVHNDILSNKITNFSVCPGSRHGIWIWIALPIYYYDHSFPRGMNEEVRSDLTPITQPKLRGVRSSMSTPWPRPGGIPTNKLIFFASARARWIKLPPNMVIRGFLGTRNSNMLMNLLYDAH